MERAGAAVPWDGTPAGQMSPCAGSSRQQQAAAGSCGGTRRDDLFIASYIAHCHEVKPKQAATKGTSRVILE